MGRLPHHLGIALLLAASLARAEEVPVLVSGKEAGQVYLYKVGEERFLDAKAAVQAYGGRFEWRTVSDRVQLSVRGRQAQLTVGSKRARVGGVSVELPEAVMVRANTVLVPLEFFQSEAFASLAQADARLDGGRLWVQPRANVRKLRWFSYPDHTRVVLELEERVMHSLSRRGRSVVEIAMPMGVVDAPQSQRLGDGIVAGVTLKQGAHLARLDVELDDKSPRAVWETQTMDAPNRLVLDIYRDRDALVAAGRDPRVVGDAAAPASEQEPDPDVIGPAAEPASAPAAEARAPAVEESSAPTAPSTAAAAPVPAAEPAAPAKPPKIVLDPGHGGRDSGATGRRGTREKDVNLQVGLELAKRLREKGFEVLLTRSDDTFIPLAERSRRANDFDADLFVSLHCNANTHRSERGFEIYFLSERASDPEAERVADMENASLALESNAPSGEAEAAAVLHAMAKTEFINDGSIAAGVLSRALGKRVALSDRGVKQAAFYVLRGTNAPAVLVEMGFVSNPKEESELKSKPFRKKIVDGIYAGILDYGKRLQWESPRP